MDYRNRWLRTMGFLVAVTAGCAGAGSGGDGPAALADLHVAPKPDMHSNKDLTSSSMDDLTMSSTDDLTVPPMSGDGGSPDLTVPATGDGGMSGCMSIATWPGLMAIGGYDTQNMDTFVVSTDVATAPFNALTIEDYHMAGAAYPKAVTFSNKDNYTSCDVCPYIAACMGSPLACAGTYFAQGGTVTVTKADSNATAGNMTATATNLLLVQWDFMADKAVTGGKCILVGSASWNVTWPAAPMPDMAVTSSKDMSTGPVDFAGSDFKAPAPDLLPPPPSDGGVTGCHPIINEIQTGGAKASDEFVEIFNPCTSAIDMTGWKLVYRSAGDNGGGSDITYFTFMTSLAAGKYFVLGGSSFGGPTDGTFSSGLAGTGGAVGLRNAAGMLADSCAWATLTTANALTEGTGPAPNPPAKSSIERLPNGTDTNDNSKDFKVTASPTPGAANK